MGMVAQIATDQRSITGKRWVWRPEVPSQTLALAQRLGLPEVVARLLAARGHTLDTAPDYLNPNLARLPDPTVLHDMPAALARLMHAITHAEPICIFGDYDVDGACASALLLRYFRQLGLTPQLYIPDRLTEGYGPSPAAMAKIAAGGAKVVITVDCGCVAFSAMEAAQAAGLDVIITDHHQATPQRPVCVAHLNPNQPQDSSGLHSLCGTGVVFMLLVGLNRALREANWFTPARPAPDLRQYLDLVAVATVADVMPLTDLNRLLVTKGLQQLATRQNPGLRALLDVAGVNTRPQAWHLGFTLGPRLNAGGRISACDLGATILSTDDNLEASTLAQRLQQLNAERQEIEHGVLQQALAAAEAQLKTNPIALVLAGEGWHPGVVGIVAGRVKDQFHRPTFVLGIGNDGIAKGSGRSVSGVDLGLCIQHLRPMLKAGGGHAMAAGVTLEASQIDAFRTALTERIQAQIAAAPEALVPKITLDAPLRPAAATLDLVEKLSQLEPFGLGNPEPKFVFSGVRIDTPRVVGVDHLQCTISDTSGRVKAVAFRALQGEGTLGRYLLQSAGQSVSVCGTLKAHTWQDRTSVQLQLDDVWAGQFNG